MKKLLVLFFSLSVINFCFSQSVGVGTTSPNVNAALDISSSSKGLLIPRMDSASRKNIPATNGMMLYDTDTKCFWYHDGTRWVNMPPKGNSTGDVLYWNGTAWAVLPAGSSGQYLSLLPSGVPAWATVNTGGTGGNITTNDVSNIAPTTVQCGGTIASDGGAIISARGVVWSTSPFPTVALTTKTNDGTGIGSFTSNLINLAPATTYYVRAYYTNSIGTTYGNQVRFSTISSFSVGQTYGGGKIFYVDGTGQHGLIVSPEDQSIGLQWYNQTYVETGATGLAIGTGTTNTTSIITAQGNGSYPASLCRLFYNGGGFTDWFLPSLYEMNELNLASSSLGLSNLDGTYWTSTEISTSYAWEVTIYNTPVPNQQSTDKYYTRKVRAIRKF